MKKLNLGSGLKPEKGYINVDFVKREGVDVIHNLEKFPYPFKDNEFDEVLVDNVLEHLEDTIKVMEELHRISKHNGIIKIIVPHYSSCGAFNHLTHKRYFGSSTFDSLEEDRWQYYTKVRFKILENRLKWFSMRNWIWIRPLKYLIDGIININPIIAITTATFAKVCQIRNL